MALVPLADVTDLAARGVDLDDEIAEVFLEVASSLVREAAQGPVSETTSDVVLWVLDDDPYVDLPGKPVTEVSAVALDGDTLSADSYRMVHGRLWISSWVCPKTVPLQLDVTLTHGFPVVPSYIVQLVCDLAILGANSASEGALDPRVVIEQIDDYKVTFADGADLVSSAMTLPVATRRALRSRFGGGAGMVSQR